MEGTMKCGANYKPLTPISFLERAAIVYRDNVSIVYGDIKFTWGQTFDRCLKLGSALNQLDISRGDVVALLSSNIPEAIELHFGVPMAGGILCMLNKHQNASTLYDYLIHLEAKVLFVDFQFLEIAMDALAIASKRSNKLLPKLIFISDKSNVLPSVPGANNILEYESLLKMGSPEFEIVRPNDECDPITLSYTSGTTSNPKCVVYNHRGAYLNSLASILSNDMTPMPVYLWTVPMYHCNGWCMIWGVAAQGGTNVCTSNVSAKGIFDSICEYGVSHMGGAPTILNMIINAPNTVKKIVPQKVIVMVGGASPPPEVLLRMEELGFMVIHAYGQTECYGPGTICTWKPEWNSLSPNEQAKLKTRQGFQHVALEDVDIKDPSTMKSVPRDGKTLGEIMLRGNTIMSGYFKNSKATEEAFRGGWFHTGDLGVRHADGYIEMKDRANDIIISGEEYISSVEIEAVLFSHPAILEAAVIGIPNDDLGESPCAFVKLKDGSDATPNEIIEFCCDYLPQYMAPCKVVFEEFPITSTGKTQKFMLRNRVNAMGSL